MSCWCSFADVGQAQIGSDTQEEELEENHFEPTESGEEADVQLHRLEIEDLLDHGETQRGRPFHRQRMIAITPFAFRLGILRHPTS